MKVAPHVRVDVEAKKRNPPLIVFFPSHDGRVLLPTLLTIVVIAEKLKRPLLAMSTNGLGQAVAINGMLLNFRRMFRNPDGTVEEFRGITRALWIEDDIMLDISQSQEIADMIVEADKHRYNMVTPYTTGMRENGEQNWVYFKFPNVEKNEIGRPFTLSEIQALKPYDKINGLAGLGFYYGDINTDYVFYEGTFNGKDRFGLPSYSGIDWNYFLDNGIELRHYPIVILHDKSHLWDNYAALNRINPSLLEELPIVNASEGS